MALKWSRDLLCFILLSRYRHKLRLELLWYISKHILAFHCVVCIFAFFIFNRNLAIVRFFWWFSPSIHVYTAIKCPKIFNLFRLNLKDKYSMGGGRKRMVGKKPSIPWTLHKINIYTRAFSIIKWAIKEELTKHVRIKYSQYQSQY